MAYHSVDDYINKAPLESRPMLKELRQTIKEAAPEAEEKISYGMPYYSYHGRLIYFASWKTHIGLYVMAGAREALAEEIKPYQKAKATLHFPIDRPLPVSLIKKIVRAQVVANQA